MSNRAAIKYGWAVFKSIRSTCVKLRIASTRLVNRCSVLYVSLTTVYNCLTAASRVSIFFKDHPYRVSIVEEIPICSLHVGGRIHEPCEGGIAPSAEQSPHPPVFVVVVDSKMVFRRAAIADSTLAVLC